jgi:DNA-binding transcriptional MerR regulator
MIGSASSLLVSIREFSDFTGVKQSVLRYYDAIGLFQPVERGENNYRYYSLEQIQTIKLIDTLRALKVPLKKIEEIMQSRSPEAMIGILTQHEVELNNELRVLQESFALIHMLRTLMQNDIPLDENEISIKFLDELCIALGQVNDFCPDEEYHRVYSNYYRTARNLRVNLSYPIGGYFDTIDEFLKTPSQPKRYFSLDPNGLDLRKAGNYIVAYTRGGYGEMSDLPQRIGDYMKANGITKAGPVYQIYPLNEMSTKDPHNYLQQISIRVS